jgi:DNA-binding GntR family transcriptional regulator
VLGTYLRYKKKYITVSSDAEDPKKSATVARYLKLSKQYMKQYHSVQLSIKTSYGRAQVHQSSYFKLSKQYQAKAAEAKKIGEAVKATATAATANEQVLAAALVKVAAEEAVRAPRPPPGA